MCAVMCAVANGIDGHSHNTRVSVCQKQYPNVVPLQAIVGQGAAAPAPADGAPSAESLSWMQSSAAPVADPINSATSAANTTPTMNLANV
jgi:hypothetical protein